MSTFAVISGNWYRWVTTGLGQEIFVFLARLLIINKTAKELL
jgi:hypothetical protein